MVAPKLRFKEFDGDWNSIAIGHFLKIKSGLGFKAEEYTTEEEIRLLQIENVGYGAVKWTHNVKFVPSNYLELHRDLVLNEGDLVLALNRPVTNDQLKIAKLTKEDTPSILYQRVGKLDFLKKDFDRDFIFQIFLKDVKSYVLNSSIGSDQPFISTTDLYKHKLSIPSKEEQTKIAAFLSAVDEKISQLTQKHELLNQYKQGMMQKLFSQQIRFKADDGSEFGEWGKIKFLDLMVDLWDYRGKTPKKLGMDWGDGEIQSLSALNIKKGFIDFDADCHLGSEKLYKTWMNKGDLEKDDIIFTMEAPLGNVALIPDDRKYILSQRVVCFKTNKKMIDNKFIFQLILSDQFQSRIEELATGTTAKGINQKSMQKIEVTLPPKDEQTKIASFLSAIDQKVDVVAQQIEQAKIWKKGLLQQMFV